MNLSTLITYLREEIGQHADIKQTDYGSEYDNDVSGNYSYPMCFIESDPTTRTVLGNGAKQYQLAMQFLDAHRDGDKAGALAAVGRMEPLMDEVQEYLNELSKQLPPEEKVLFKWDTALSMTYATDTITGGWRVEVTVTVNGERCSWKSKFPQQ